MTKHDTPTMIDIDICIGRNEADQFCVRIIIGGLESESNAKIAATELNHIVVEYLRQKVNEVGGEVLAVRDLKAETN